MLSSRLLDRWWETFKEGSPRKIPGLLSCPPYHLGGSEQKSALCELFLGSVLILGPLPCLSVTVPKFLLSKCFGDEVGFVTHTSFETPFPGVNLVLARFWKLGLTSECHLCCPDRGFADPKKS